MNSLVERGVDSEFPLTEKSEETYTTGRLQYYVIRIVKVQGLFGGLSLIPK